MVQSLTLMEDTYFPDLEAEEAPSDPGEAKYRDEILMLSVSDVSPKSYLVAMTFDTGPIMAAGTEVISGTLALSAKYCVKDELPIALGLGVYLIDEPWNPTSITGELVPEHRELVASMELLDSSPEVAIWDTEVRIDISRAIEAWQSGTANHGLMLKLFGGGLSHATCVFSSLESDQPPRAQVATMMRSKIMLPLMVIGQLDWPR